MPMFDNRGSFEIRCLASGDFAEAEDVDAALVAADTLARDYADARKTQGALDRARHSLLVVRDGKLDGVATEKARRGWRTT